MVWCLAFQADGERSVRTFGILHDLVAWLYFRWAATEIDRRHPDAAVVSCKLADYERRLGIKRGQRCIRF